MAKSVGTQIAEQKRSFEDALKGSSYTDAQKEVFKNAIDSLEYICAFYEGRYKLPYLEIDAESDWGKTHEWLMGSYINVHMAQKILDGEKKPIVKLGDSPSNECSCRMCKSAMQNKSLRVAVNNLRTEKYACNVKSILRNILVVLKRYKCETTAILYNRTNDVMAMMYNYEGFIFEREVYREERIALDMLISEFECFLATE